MFSTVLAWNTKTYGDKGPQSWADFWDVKKFPGKRAYRKGVAGALEPALMADGVPPDKVYEVLSTPAGIERAIKKIKELKPHIAVWWSSGAQHAQLMKDGEVDMVTGWNGRFDVVAKDGGKVAYTFNQALLDYDCYAIPKGAPNKDLAMKFLAEISKPQYQAEFTKYITYGPTNKKAYDLGTIDAAYAQAPALVPGQRGQAVADQPGLVHQARSAGRDRLPEHAHRIALRQTGAQPFRSRLRGAAQALRRGPGARRRRPRRAQRRVPDAAGPVGLGQDDAADGAGRLHPPRPGARLQFGDDEVIRLAPHKRDIGMVFQNYALFPHMDVAANIAYPLKLRGVGGPNSSAASRPRCRRCSSKATARAASTSSPAASASAWRWPAPSSSSRASC